MQVHPTYYLDTKRWETDDGVTAKSLQSLQIKLPKAKIVDYYPDGFGYTVDPKPKLPPPTPQKKLDPPKYLQGELPFKEITWARDVDIVDDKPAPKVPAVVKFVPIRPPRQRAESAFPPVNWEEKEPELRRLAAQGLSAAKIAAQFNCSANAIIGRCHHKGIPLLGRG
jgi:hypothetical protein